MDINGSTTTLSSENPRDSSTKKNNVGTDVRGVDAGDRASGRMGDEASRGVGSGAELAAEVTSQSYDQSVDDPDTEWSFNNTTLNHRKERWKEEEIAEATRYS